MTTTLTRLSSNRCRYDDYSDRSQIIAFWKAVWGFAPNAADSVRDGPLPYRVVHLELHAVGFVLQLTPLLLEPRYLLGGTLMHYRHVLRIVLQFWLQLRSLLSAALRCRNRQFSLRPSLCVIWVRTAFVRGKTLPPCRKRVTAWCSSRCDARTVFSTIAVFVEPTSPRLRRLSVRCGPPGTRTSLPSLYNAPAAF